MKVRGHPVLGAISGFLLGLFVGADLFLFGLVESDSAVITVLPFLGLIAGLALAVWAPIRRRRTDTASTES